MPITDNEIVSKIKQIHRAVFIKDVALARNLEDSTFAALTQFIYSFQSEIIIYIQNNESYSEQLFSLIYNPKSTDQQKDAIDFFVELTNLAKPFTKETRYEFYKYFIK